MSDTQLSRAKRSPRVVELRYVQAAAEVISVADWRQMIADAKDRVLDKKTPHAQRCQDRQWLTNILVGKDPMPLQQLLLSRSPEHTLEESMSLLTQVRQAIKDWHVVSHTIDATPVPELPDGDGNGIGNVEAEAVEETSGRTGAGAKSGINRRSSRTRRPSPVRPPAPSPIGSPE